MKTKVESKLNDLINARDKVLQEIENIKHVYESKQAELISITGSINTLQGLLVEEAAEDEN